MRASVFAQSFNLHQPPALKLRPSSDIYVADQIEAVVEAAGLKPVETGSNIRLLTPYDECVFYNANEINGLRVACPVQVYLDVLAQRGRGEEAAGHQEIMVKRLDYN